ncbi:MAG: hypothetical protein WCJ61_02395 [Paludibacter sp.]
MEERNNSANFGNMANPSSKSMLANSKKSNTTNLAITNNISDLSSIELPSYKRGSTSSGNTLQPSNPDFPSTGVAQVDVQNMNNSVSNAQITRRVNYVHNEYQSFAMGNSTEQYLSNPQNLTKSDFNVMLLLDTHVAEVSLSSQQGSKRATPALAAKTASASTSLTDKKGVKKVGENPVEPGIGGSLPIGNGISILLGFVAVYSAKKYFIV